MCYYVFKDDSEFAREQVAKSLESKGIVKSKYSCPLNEAKGIGLAGMEKPVQYIFFNERMMSKDAHIGWVEPYRKEVKELNDFFNKATEMALSL